MCRSVIVILTFFLMPVLTSSQFCQNKVDTFRALQIQNQLALSNRLWQQ